MSYVPFTLLVEISYHFIEGFGFPDTRTENVASSSMSHDASVRPFTILAGAETENMVHHKLVKQTT